MNQKTRFLNQQTRCLNQKRVFIYLFTYLLFIYLLFIYLFIYYVFIYLLFIYYLGLGLLWDRFGGDLGFLRTGERIRGTAARTHLERIRKEPSPNGWWVVGGG